MLRTLWGARSDGPADGPHHLGRPGRQLIGPAHDALRGQSSRSRGERSGADELPARAGKEKLGGAQEKDVAHVAALIGTDEGPPSSLVSCLRLRLAAVVARPHDGPHSVDPVSACLQPPVSASAPTHRRRSPQARSR